MQYRKPTWWIFQGTANGLTPHEDIMVSRYRGRTDLQKLALLEEQTRRAEGDDSLLVAKAMSREEISQAFCPKHLKLHKLDPKAVREYDEYRHGERATNIPELQKPISKFERWWLTVSAEPVAVNQITDVFGYVPKIPDFMEEEQAAFVEHAEKIMRPGMKRMKMVGRYIGRFRPMPGKSQEEMVQNYYNRKYLDGIRDKYPLPPRPSCDNKRKNRKNGFTEAGGIRRGKAHATTLVRVERAPRMRKPRSKVPREDLDDVNSGSRDIVRSNAKKRARSNISSPTPAPKRAKTQKPKSLSVTETAGFARPKAPPRKRRIEDVDSEDEVESPVETKQKRLKAGEGKPKNIDEAFLKIIKKRFLQVKESGKRGDAFTEHFLGPDFNLPALIPYSQRPMRNNHSDNDRVRVDTPPQQLKMPEETFILAQQCLILTLYILQEQRNCVEPGNTRRFNTSQWQHCAFGDANNLHDLGDEMDARGMFDRDWCPALYDRAESDLAALAKWEDGNAPAEGFWPEKAFCKPRMVWRPEVSSAVEDPALEKEDADGEGEDVKSDSTENLDEEMDNLAQLPPITRDIVGQSGIPAEAVASVHQCVLRAARNHVQISPGESEFEEMIAETALQEIDNREDEEEADMRMLAVVRAMIVAGDLGVLSDNLQPGDVQEGVADDHEAVPEALKAALPSSGKMSAGSLPSLTFSTLGSGTASPDPDALRIAGPAEARVTSLPLLDPSKMGEPRYFDHLTSPEDAAMYWNGLWWTKAQYEAWWEDASRATSTEPSE